MSAPTPTTTKPLTPQQRAFVSYYLRGEPGERWNASEAARKAGYSAKTAGQIGYQLLQNPSILKEIEVHLADLRMSATEVLTRVTEQARADLGDFIDITESGGWRLNLQKAAERGKLGQIKRLKSGQWGPEIELYDAQASLFKIGEHHKLWGKSADLLKLIDLSKLSDDQLGRLAEGEDPIKVLLG